MYGFDFVENTSAGTRVAMNKQIILFSVGKIMKNIMRDMNLSTQKNRISS
jgi:hypothetical protein